METLGRDENVSTMTTTAILRALLVGAVSLAIHLFVMLLIVVFLVGVVPAYVEFFEVHDTPIPWITYQLVEWSSTAVGYWYVLFLAVLLFDGPTLFAFQFLPRSLRWLKVLWFDTFLLAAIVFLMCGSIALCMPIAEMTASRGGP